MKIIILFLLFVSIFIINGQNVCKNEGDCFFLKDCGAEVLNYISSQTTIGYHVACLSYQFEMINSLIFVNGNEEKSIGMQALDWVGWKSSIAQHLKLDEVGENPSNKYDWAIFSTEGNPIDSLEVALASKIVLIFKGGYFIWPGISIGYKRELKGLSGIGSVTMTTLSLQPLLYELEGFLSLEECDHIRKTALPTLKPSPVSKMDADQDIDHTHWRTSYNCFLGSQGDPILTAIDKRVNEITKAPISHQESAQVLRYELGQRYSAHTDYFPPQYYQTEANKYTLSLLDGGRRNRFITVFWYLSNVEEGGETIFPRAGGLPSPTNFNDCNNGLKVSPKEGKAIMFYSMTPEGQFDEYSLHGACPVIQGTKWAANKWIWTNPFVN